MCQSIQPGSDRLKLFVWWDELSFEKNTIKTKRARKRRQAGLPLQKCMRRLFGFLWFRYINGFQRRERERDLIVHQQDERESQLTLNAASLSTTWTVTSGSHVLTSCLRMFRQSAIRVWLNGFLLKALNPTRAPVLPSSFSFHLLASGKPKPRTSVARCCAVWFRLADDWQEETEGRRESNGNEWKDLKREGSHTCAYWST